MNHQENHYSVGDEKAEALIEELLDFCQSAPPGRPYLREILTTIAKLGLESKDIGDFKLVNTALKELRYSLKLFSPYRQMRKAVIFGSARTPESDPCYQLAAELGRRLAKQGWGILTGAGGGIMEAGHRGAGGESSFGINIKLPFEQTSNPYIAGNSKLMTFKYFFTRKLTFIKETDATILFPGGFGTMDEGFENLTLFQTGKSMPRPILLMEPEGKTYWKRWNEFIEAELFRSQYLSPEDRHLFQIVHDVDQAVEIITGYYRVYHSLRYVGPKTALRLNCRPGDEILKALNRDFADLLTGGEFELTGPLPDEILKNEYVDLPRLVFYFDKSKFGRLNQLIQFLNQSVGETSG